MEWTVDSGPGSVGFDNTTIEDPTVTLTVAGEYVLRLSADDGALVGEDTVKIEVYEEAYTGLIALWPLDGNADDIIGGHNGTLRGDPEFDVDAQVGSGSVLLDGIGDYIEIEGTADPNLTTWADLRDEVTVTTWIKVNRFTIDMQAVINKCDYDVTGRMDRGVYSFQIRF